MRRLRLSSFIPVTINKNEIFLIVYLILQRLLINHSTYNKSSIVVPNVCFIICKKGDLEGVSQNIRLLSFYVVYGLLPHKRKRDSSLFHMCENNVDTK